MASDDIRLTYVALTRAQSQVVAWWAPSWDEPNGGLSRLLRGRAPGEAAVPDRCEPKISDADALAALPGVGGRRRPVVEESVLADARPGAGPADRARTRRTPLRPHHRHVLAPHVVLRSDPVGGGVAGA